MARHGKIIGTDGEGIPLAASVMSIRDFAAMIDVSAEWVRLRIAEGYIPKAARGRVVLIDATRGAARYFEDQAKRAMDRVEDISANRYRNARAEEVEARNARKLETFIPRAEAEYVMEVITSQAEEQLQRVLAGMPSEVRGKATEAMAGALDRIGKRFEDLSAALASGDFDRYEKAR